MYPCEGKWPLGDRKVYQAKCILQKLKPNHVWIIWQHVDYENNPQFIDIFYNKWDADIKLASLGTECSYEIEETEIK